MVKVHYSESASASEASRALSHELASVISDLNYLSLQEGLLELVSSDNSQGYNHLQNNWLTFSHSKKSYDQIRWLDLTGKERLRINFNNGQPLSIAENKLQNKAQRYYFIDTIKLNKDEVFISPLDLNIEDGEIEQPLKPMIRLGSPIFDRSGQKQGVVLINYTATKLLDRFKHVLNDENSAQWLLNSDGYWLKGPSPEQEWGFMFQQPQQSMASQYPHAWQQISASEQGQFIDEHGLWTFNTVHPLLSGSTSGEIALERNQYYWKTVFLIPKQQLLAYSWQAGIKLGIATIIIILGFFIAIWWETKSWNTVQKMNQSLEERIAKRTEALLKAKEQAEALACTDELTDLNNRRSFFNYGSHIHQQAARYKRPYCVLMLDLDLFKKVNDTYGHQIGDEALKASSKAIKSMTRTSDISGRVGGEEFALILPETATEEAKDLAERLRRAIADINIPLDSGVLKLTVSIGISEKGEEDSSIDEALARADKALYQAKEQGRNQVAVFIS